MLAQADSKAAARLELYMQAAAEEKAAAMEAAAEEKAAAMVTAAEEHAGVLQAQQAELSRRCGEHGVAMEDLANDKEEVGHTREPHPGPRAPSPEPSCHPHIRSLALCHHRPAPPLARTSTPTPGRWRRSCATRCPLPSARWRR